MDTNLLDVTQHGFSHPFIFHVRDCNNQVIGTLVASVKNSVLYIGWSKKCKNDHLNRRHGINMALTRMVRQNKFLPLSLQNRVFYFIERCKKYFDTPKGIMVGGQEIGYAWEVYKDYNKSISPTDVGS